MSQVQADYFYQKPEVKKKTKKLCEEIQRRRNLAFGKSNLISYEIGRKYLKVGEVAPTFGGLLNTKKNSAKIAREKDIFLHTPSMIILYL